MADEARAPAPRTPPPPRDPKRRNLRVSGAPQKTPMIPWKPGRFIAIVIGLFILNWIIVGIVAPQEKRIQVPYNPTFLNQVRNDNVKEISSSGDTVQGEFKNDVTYKDETAKQFETEFPTFADDAQLSKLLEDHNVTITAEPPNQRSLLQTILLGFGPTILLVALFVWFFRRAASGGGIGQFGRSRARRVEPASQTVTFQDVAGIEEAEHELVEVVDFLQNPGRYRALGARIPRGVLLAGAPGTGKTLLARAVAGEAGVPFFSARALRQARLRAAARRCGTRGDPARPHALGAARRRGGPGPPGVLDTRHGRGRPRQPRERGGASRRAPRPRPRAVRRLHRSAREDRARRGAEGADQ